MTLDDVATPALVLDRPRMLANIARMRGRLAELGVAFRPHVKTCKSPEVARLMLDRPDGPITVSTLKEAAQFAAHGVTDILYAVGIVPGKLDAVASLRARGCGVAVLLDSVAMARVLSDYCRERALAIPALIEVDTDGHRSGVEPGDPALIEVAAALRDGATLRGVMTHAGASYDCRTEEELAAMAEQERAGAVHAAARLRAAGHAAPVVSVGSTPTALSARSLDGVTEVRAGVFVFFDLVMAGIGVCRQDDIALSVLASVIGHRADKGWVITDAGWMAMSRDRGTAKQRVDQGYGVVLDVDGRPLPGLWMSDANQEHGIVSRRDGGAPDFARLPIGSRLRILPNHACATAAQHDAYRVVDGTRGVTATWPRFSGW
ncbi:MAG TPA: DSD1 family PLP-dependent enzyme [Casimicrobiaceae bacterium]|nr:DSD1 family PLP-dependent enzyme [Casimicrobiaceae bacterium]